MQSSLSTKSEATASSQLITHFGEIESLRVVSQRSDSSNLEFEVELPGYYLEPSRVFTYPSHMADLYTAAIEQVYVPETTIAPSQIRIKVFPGNTGAKQNGTLTWKAQRQVKNLLQPKSVLDLSDHYIFDSRFELDTNISHILESISAPALLAQKVISEYLGRSIKVQVIVREQVAKLARETYEALGISLICTDDDVFGNIIQVSAPCFALRSLQPHLFNIDFPGSEPTTPERVFIPRRGNRRLINNDEVIQFLSQRGFQTIYFEDLTPSQEWSITRNAKVAVSVHGAGTYNFVFNRTGVHQPPGQGLKLIEIFSPCFALTGCRHFAGLLNGKWCAIRGQVTPKVLRYLDFDHTPREVEKSPIKDPFKVDLKSLEMALNYLDV